MKITTNKNIYHVQIINGKFINGNVTYKKYKDLIESIRNGGEKISSVEI